MRLSACVIVKNEEKNLPKWLESMKKIVDEMIVIDTGSIDQTKQIAENAGAKVYDFIWTGDFAAAKNFALEKATGEWILFLDADEYFTDETIMNIPVYLQKINANKNIDAFLCRLVNVDADSDYRVINTVNNLRIFRNQADLRFRGAVHEMLVKTGTPLKLARLEIDAEIYHTGYSKSIVKGKLERNLEILKKDIKDHGELKWHYAYLADCYYGLKEYEKAAYYAKMSIDAKIKALGQESSIYRRWIDSLSLGGEDSLIVLSAIEHAIAKFPHMPEFVWNKGEILFQETDYSGSERYLLKALKLHEKQGKHEMDGAFSGQINLLYCRLGQLAEFKGNVAQAMEYYVESLLYCKYNGFVLNKLYQILRKQDPVDALSLLQSIYSKEKRNIEFLVDILKAYPLDKIYLYYVQLLKKNYKLVVDDISVAALLTSNRQELAVNKIGQEIKEQYLEIIISVIALKDNKKYQEALLILPSQYKNVLQYLLSKSVELTAQEQMLYEQVKNMLLKVKLDNKDQGENMKEEVLPSGDFVSIIIVVHNHLVDTQNCINALRALIIEEKYEILVVDNASDNQMKDWLAGQADIKVISNQKNIGFTAACNQAIAMAGGSELLLLHNDVLLTPHCLTNLKKLLHSDERIGAVAPVAYASGWMQQPDSRELYETYDELQLAARKIEKNSKNAEQTLLLESFCLLIKKEAIETVGLFDERFYPRYYEDIDYSLRLIKAGYKLMIAKKVLVHHAAGSTFKDFGENQQKYFDYNFIQLKEKWGFAPQYACCIREELLNMMDLKKEHLTVLDVGCACGGNLMRIKEQNPKAKIFGVELNSDSAIFAAQFGTIDNINIETDEKFSWTEKFDYIILADIVEHLYDPLRAIKRLKKFLKADGCIVMSIPNIMHISVIADLLKGNWNYSEAGILDKTHIRFFTKESIEKMIVEAGMKLRSIGYNTVNITEEEASMKKKLESTKRIIEDKSQFDAYQWLVLMQNKK